MVKLNIEIDIIKVEKFNNKDTLAKVYYPNEGNHIKIVKGLNVIELSESIFHEIGHIIDWYLSSENQSKNKVIREKIADDIGESLRWREERN